MKFEVGMKVWVVSEYRKAGAERTITKIGRRWAETNMPGERFDIKTRQVDGGPYIVYESEQAWKEEIELQEEWNSLRRCISSMYAVPQDMTVERIHQIKMLLGI